MKVIGTASSRDFDKLNEWLSNLSIESAEKFVQQVNEIVEKQFPEECGSSRTGTDAYCIKQVTKELYQPIAYSRLYISTCDWSEEDAERENNEKWQEKKKKTAEALQKHRAFHETFDQPLNVGVWTDTFAFLYFGNPETGIVVPTPAEYFTFCAISDYDNIPIAQLSAGKVEAGPAIYPAAADGTATKSGLSVSKEKQEKELANLLDEMEQVTRAETPELAEIKAEIAALEVKMQKRKQEMMLELEDKLGDMQEKVAQMEAQIFLLDAQIYAIRCLAGEVVKFAHIRKGENAPDTEPIIIYQKLRFLDEDLGRLTSIYHLDWSEVEMFEDFLRYSPAALDTFAPNERCVTLVRLSRNATHLGRSRIFPYSNLLESYEYFHGRTVGIIIRNGENVYFGWTDEDRIHITDDLIISQITTEVVPAEPPKTYDDPLWEKRKQREERMKATAEQMTIMDGIVSRAFVFNILQGIVQNTAWLPLPPGEDISKQSAYVRFSIADMCLMDRRFSDFNILIGEANKDIAAGDMILTMQNLIPESNGRYKTYCNSRGRGDANRTHDCHVDDCTIYPANLVEYDAPVQMIRYRIIDKWRQREDGSDPEYETAAADECNLSPDCEVIARWDYIERHVFLSIEKKGWYDSKNVPRANFEVMSDEFINLTFMNSVWLEWAVNTKNLGSWHIKGKEIDYAHAIRYLNTALEYVRKREEEEKRLISELDASICAAPEWQLLLSDWKFMLSRDESKRTVRRMTEFQAKRFVQWVKDGMPGRKNYSKLETDCVDNP